MTIINEIKIEWFATKSWLTWEQMTIETKNILSSNDKLFFDRIESIAKLIPGINIDSLSSFLIVINKDYQAKIYINDEIWLIMWIKPKRDIQKWSPVYKNDILDIETIKFSNIEINESDRIIYCQKVEWKFFLYYDLWRTQKKLDIEAMYKELGATYRSLFFERTYLLAKEENFEKAISQWRFPFIEIIWSYRQILWYHGEDENKKTIFIGNFVNEYDKKIDSIIEKWRSKGIFLQKKDIIASGINNYKNNSKDWIISCIKTLSSEIEGIIRIVYYKDKNFSKNSQKKNISEYVNNIIKYWEDKKTTLFFPDLFLNFLNNVFFENWYLWENTPSTTRHTVNHWILPSNGYTKEKAFQMILILDQIYFYLP